MVALVLGALIFLLGGAQGIYFLLVILIFLVASAIVTSFKKGRKVAMKTYERARGWRNVLANGVVPLLVALLYYINGMHHMLPQADLVVAYVASVAAITADKFSSELGILDNNVIMIATLKKIRPGISGGVSMVGIAAGALGAFIIGLGLFSFPDFLLLLGIVVASGLIGDLVDSFLGYFEEQGIGNKYTSNIGCAIVGAVLGAALAVLLL